MSALVVWQPKQGGQEKDVPEATATFSDPRARHFWDGPGRTLQQFKPVLGIQVDAWDLYLLYRPGVRWDGAGPPRPDDWMHQLTGVENGPPLDADVFGRKIVETLGAAGPPPSGRR